MPFRSAFDCLWCGQPHATRGPDDIEGWAGLCPACIGRAGENGYLRFRLRAALDERGRTRAVGPPWLAGPPDDWYERRGRWSRGAIEDALWAADLDAATLWLDDLQLAGTIVELEAGSGWWTPLLATKGELWAFVDDPAELEAARARLVAHGLRAHLHLRSPDAAPDRAADVLVTTFRLGRRPTSEWAAALVVARRWLRPGGRHVLLELGDAADGLEPSADDRAAGSPRPVARTVLAKLLAEAGFRDIRLEGTPRLLMGSAVA